jgi:hypothetical protein
MLLVTSNAHFNPRFQPAFVPSPFSQQQRNMISYPGLSFPQMPSFGSLYGSPFYNPNSLNDLSILEQQQMFGSMSDYYQSSFMMMPQNPLVLPSPLMLPPYDDLTPAFNQGYRQIPYTKEVIESKKKRSFN